MSYAPSDPDDAPSRAELAEPLPATVVVSPGTGELVDLSQLATDDLAAQLDEFAEHTKVIARFRRVASDELAARLDHEGRRSAEVGEWHIEVTAPTQKDWDVDRLADTLDRFVEKGTISQAKASRCLRVKVEPVWSEVKTLLSDPRTAPEVSLCFEEAPATRTIKLRPVDRRQRRG